MSTLFEPDPDDVAEVRDVFARLVADEPPLVVDVVVLDRIERLAHDERRGRARRRRTAAAAVVAAAAAVAVVAVVGAGTSDDGPGEPAGPASPGPAGGDVSTEGAARIADVMVDRLQEVYPGGVVSWETLPTTGSSRSDVGLRFTVDGVPGDLELTSTWGTLVVVPDVACAAWHGCPTGNDAFRSWVYGSPDDDPSGRWSYWVSRSEATVSLTGSLEALASEAALADLVRGDALFVAGTDLTRPQPEPPVVGPAPDARQLQDLARLRGLARGWADDLGLPDARAYLEGELAAVRAPWPRVGVDLSSATTTVEVRFDPVGDLIDVPACTESPGCRETPVDGGLVVLEPGDQPRFTFLDDRGGATSWRFNRLPDGWDADRLASYVGAVGVPITSR